MTDFKVSEVKKTRFLGENCGITVKTSFWTDFGLSGSFLTPQGLLGVGL